MTEAAWAEFVEIYEPLVYRLAANKGSAGRRRAGPVPGRLSRGGCGHRALGPGPGQGPLSRLAVSHHPQPAGQLPGPAAATGRGSGSTSVQELLEAQPAGDAEAEAEFAAEFKRRAFRWAADQVKNEFAESTWQAFWKTGVENRPVAVVADELGLSAGAVYIARSRVLARLRDRVEPADRGHRP